MRQKMEDTSPCLILPQISSFATPVTPRLKPGHTLATIMATMCTMSLFVQNINHTGDSNVCKIKVLRFEFLTQDNALL